VVLVVLHLMDMLVVLRGQQGVPHILEVGVVELVL